MAINEQALSHTSSNSTKFTATRADLCCAVTVQKPAGISEVQFMQDVAEFASWHALSIWPNLNGFSGYDCIQFEVQEE